jgi:hypothetical protein
MITTDLDRRNFWLRVKLFLTFGNTDAQSTPAKTKSSTTKRRSHRTTAFFELP